MSPREGLIIIFIIGVIVFLLFSFVIIFGAPFLPTLKKQIKPALELLDLKPGQTLLELGCGDGRMLIAAAEHGVKSVGYELNPILFAWCYLKTRRHKHLIKVVFGNYWHKKWPPTDAIFVFLLDPFMEKLNTRIIQTYDKKVKLVSFAFKIPNREIDKQKSGLFLYKYNY